jgi:hypothetical protein
MSQEQADALKELASAIYIRFTERVSISHWDWDPLANSAIEAAQSFTSVFEARYVPEATPSTDMLRQDQAQSDVATATPQRPDQPSQPGQPEQPQPGQPGQPQPEQPPTQPQPGQPR